MTPWLSWEELWMKTLSSSIHHISAQMPRLSPFYRSVYHNTFNFYRHFQIVTCSSDNHPVQHVLPRIFRHMFPSSSRLFWSRGSKTHCIAYSKMQSGLLGTAGKVERQGSSKFWVISSCVMQSLDSIMITMRAWNTSTCLHSNVFLGNFLEFFFFFRIYWWSFWRGSQPKDWACCQDKPMTSKSILGFLVLIGISLQPAKFRHLEYQRMMLKNGLKTFRFNGPPYLQL